MIAQGEQIAFSSLPTGRPIVKICGLMDLHMAVLAAEYGADMVGLVFAPSRRQVSPATAKEICRALRQSGRRVLAVGVFVNEAPHSIRKIADYVGLDVIQLSGDETPAEVDECARYRPVLRALRFPQGATTQEALDAINQYNMPGDRVRLLVDAYHPGAYGGTGQAADWELASQLASHADIMLAGGLNPGNVAQAIENGAPWGVDVSSGVEKAGAKDPTLIKEFIQAVRRR